MDKALYENVRRYNATGVLIREMLSKQIITEAEYIIVCRELVGNFGMKTITIFSEIDLAQSRRNCNF